MTPSLPPRDPHESDRLGPSRDMDLVGPVAVFVGGEPSPADDRISDALLDLRPGLLVVCARA